MLQYYREIDLEEGFEVLWNTKENRLLQGRKVSAPSGLALFTSLFESGAAMKCWACGIEANRFVLNKGKNDVVSKPVLDLFAVHDGQYTLMTRDHIIPRSFGGVNDVQNLRVGCGPCNHSRGNVLDEGDIEFLKAHPELVQERPGKTNLTLETMAPAPSEEDLQRRLVTRKKRAAARRKVLNARRKARRKIVTKPEPVTI